MIWVALLEWGGRKCYIDWLGLFGWGFRDAFTAAFRLLWRNIQMAITVCSSVLRRDKVSWGGLCISQCSFLHIMLIPSILQYTIVSKSTSSTLFSMFK